MPRFRLVALVLPLLLATVTAPARADSSRTDERRVTQLADGVWEIRHRDPYPGFVHGNTTVVIGDRDVLVVDSCQTPGAAEEDIAQIRTWTDKPVRYVVNTHWHQDHNGGNERYRAAFPGVAILAHRETRAMTDSTQGGVVPSWLRDSESGRKTAEETLAKGLGQNGKPLSDRSRKYLQQQIDQAPEIAEQAKRWVYQAPTLTFDDGLDLDLGGRTALVRHPGRGNTGGDLIVYLPKEKILIVGDLVVHPVPFVFDGYPSEWVRTLEGLAAYDADIIVPGHGDIERDKVYLLQVRDLLQAVVAQVEAALRSTAEPSLEDIKKKVDVRALEEVMLAGAVDEKGFFDYVVTSIAEVAYHEAKLR
jgi:glyoxylase-like metal-dependent hydrolase (beta-lactamase superfamily II)